MVIQEALSANKHRRYPFVENSDLHGMPDWVLLDIRLVDTNYAGSGGSLVCSRFVSDGTTATIVFTYANNENDVSFDIPVEAGSGITVGSINISDNCVVKFAVYGGGSEYRLESIDCEPAADILRSRLVLLDRAAYVHSIAGASGNIRIVDGHNTTARIVGGTVTVTPGAGAGLGSDCNPPEDAFDCSKGLLFINGQHADTSGNININGGAGVIVQSGRMAYVNGSIVPAITIKADPRVKELY